MLRLLKLLTKELNISLVRHEDRDLAGVNLLALDEAGREVQTNFDPISAAL